MGLQVKLVPCAEDAELRALIERYEQLLCDWEDLSYRSIKALAVRPVQQRERRDAIRRS